MRNTTKRSSRNTASAQRLSNQTALVDYLSAYFSRHSLYGLVGPREAAIEAKHCAKYLRAAGAKAVT